MGLCRHPASDRSLCGGGMAVFICTLMPLNWNTDISPSKVVPREAGGDAHDLPRTHFSWALLLGGEPRDLFGQGCTNIKFSIYQLCFIRLLDQSISHRVIHSGNKIHGDSGWTSKLPKAHSQRLGTFVATGLFPSTTPHYVWKLKTLLICHVTCHIILNITPDNSIIA